MSQGSESPTNTPPPAPHPDAANRLKSEFITNVSHELRTPVNAIIGYVELLADNVYGPLTEEQQQTIQYIHDSASDLLSLINNLLDVSRIESGRADLILSTFDLRDLIREVFVQLQSLADTKHLALESRVLTDQPRIRTDRTKLKQILINLLGNALKFTPSGKVSVSVTTACKSPQASATAPPRRLQIQVHDTGIGIPADRLGLIFEKFYQVDSSAHRQYEGTGLGLYITKQLLEMLAGTIDIQSTLGQGTAVTVSLPADYDEIQAVHRLRKCIADAHLTAGDQRPTGKRSVLVVSGNPDVGRILADGLGAADYAVRVVPPSTEVSTLARNLQPLVILLNAEESSLEFWSVFQELKSMPLTKDIPVIFLGTDHTRGLTAPLTVAAPLNRQEVLRSIRATTKTGRKKILVVDDDASFREVLKCVLTEDGYQVAEATNGKETLEKLNASKPDLLLLDLRMPEIDGWGVIRSLTRNPQFQDMEVLVITGDTLSDRETNALQSHTSGFISKADFKVDRVLQQVADLLEVD